MCTSSALQHWEDGAPSYLVLLLALSFHSAFEVLVAFACMKCWEYVADRLRIALYLSINESGTKQCSL